MINNTNSNKLTVFALLAVMVLISAIYVYTQQNEAQAGVQREGVALARLLSSLNWSSDEDLNVANIERLLEHQLTSENFAYGVLISKDGEPLSNTITSDHVGSLPNGLNPATSQGWLNQRTVSLDSGDLREYYGPIHGSNVADPVYFRVGYRQPSFAMSATDLPVVATLILPVIFLLPIWLFLQHRSYRPIAEINEKLSTIADGQSLQQVQVSADGELKELLDGLNGFFQQAQQRIKSAEANSQKLITQEKFLSYRAERYESILQTVPDGILILDEDFKVAFLNQHIENMFSVNRLEVTSTTVDSWCSYEPLVSYIQECRRDGLRVMSQIKHMQDPKASHRTLGISAHPLYFTRSPTSNSGTLILLRDVSQEVAAQQSRAEFVGSVSHEIKAPLNTIGLYAQMLESNGDDPEFIIDAHNTITQEVERLTRLINNLLSMTQIEMGTFEIDEQRTYLAELVKECIEMLDHGTDASRIQIIVSDDISPVLVDKELMRIAVSNLLTNALKYSPKDKQVIVHIEETDDAITLSVVDRGEGISEEDQARIFDKFYRSMSEHTQSQAGHGLGLSIAKEILRLHHGSISVQSKLSEGSKFTIELWKRTGVARQAI
jgi:signal transduction histidine kinase